MLHPSPHNLYLSQSPNPQIKSLTIYYAYTPTMSPKTALQRICSPCSFTATFRNYTITTLPTLALSATVCTLFAFVVISMEVMSRQHLLVALAPLTIVIAGCLFLMRMFIVQVPESELPRTKPSAQVVGEIMGPLPSRNARLKNVMTELRPVQRIS